MLELYEEMDNFEKTSKYAKYVSISDIKKLIINYYLEKEKEQIIEAVRETIYEMDMYESFRTLKNGEQYYQKTFVDDAR